MDKKLVKELIENGLFKEAYDVMSEEDWEEDDWEEEREHQEDIWEKEDLKSEKKLLKKLDKFKKMKSEIDSIVYSEFGYLTVEDLMEEIEYIESKLKKLDYREVD